MWRGDFNAVVLNHFRMTEYLTFYKIFAEHLVYGTFSADFKILAENSVPKNHCFNESKTDIEYPYTHAVVVKIKQGHCAGVLHGYTVIWLIVQLTFGKIVESPIFIYTEENRGSG